MQYDKYELKIRKVEKFFKMIFRNLLKIAIGASVVAGVTAVLLATKGIVTVVAEPPTTGVIYGESLIYEAKAFLSDVEYEYSASGTDNWTKEFPKDPGEYCVRAVAKATIGYRYGKVGYFTLNKKPINAEIKSGQIPYGDKPLVEAPLINGDQIVDSTIKYNLDRTYAEVTSLVIHDENGNDVSHRYAVTGIGKDISTVPRPIVLNIEGATKVYDGTPLVSHQYKIEGGSLADGDRVDIAYLNSQTDAGSVQNSASYAFFNEASEDVTRYYAVGYSEGTLTVLKREVSLSTENLSVEYNALAHTQSAYTITSEQNLADGHQLNIDGWASITDAGSIENTFSSIHVVDAQGTDISANYDIKVETGMLTVTPKPVKVTTMGYEGTYDGLLHTNVNYTQEGLVEGHFLSDIVSTEIRNVKESGTENVFAAFAVYDAANNEISLSNYEFEFTNGVHKIDPKPVKVTTVGYVGEYDGQMHTSVGYDQEGLLDGHSLSDIVSTPVCNAGTLANEFLSYTVKDASGAEIDIANYAIEVVAGEHKVTPKTVKLTTKGYLGEYDAQWHTITEYEAADGYQLVDGHYLTNITSTSIRDINQGQTSLANQFSAYTIKDASGAEIDSANYNIEWTWGSMVVTKRQVVVSSASAIREYNGSPLTADKWIVGSGDLLEGHVIEIGIKPSGSLTGAGAPVENRWEGYPNNPTYTITANGEDVKDNYEVVFKAGELKITPKKITVVSASARKDYDGKPLFANSWSVVVDEDNASLLNGLTVEGPKLTASVTNAGRSVENTFNEALDAKFTIKSGDNDVTSNYEIEYTWGTLSINPIQITITTGDGEWTYDGQGHVNIGYTCDELEANGHYLGDIVSTYIADVELDDDGNVTTVENIFTFFEIYDEEENIVTDNYEITWVYGTLQVNPKEITITTLGDSWEYNGEARSNSGYNSTGLEENGHYLDVTNSTSITDAGAATNKFDGFTIKDKNGNVISDSNYVITFVEGTLEVTKRPITFTTGNGEWTYDGNEHSQLNGYSLSGKLMGHNLTDIEFNSITNVGTVENKVISFKIMSGDFDVTANYEIIDSTWGTLTVTPREITVSTNGGAWTYDGEEHSANGWSVVTYAYDEEDVKDLLGSLSVNGPELKASITNAGSVLNVCNGDPSFIIASITIEMNGVDVTSNYTIVGYDFGELIVNKKAVTITTTTEGDREWTYDGQGHFNTSYDAPDLVEGHELKDIISTVITDANADKDGNVFTDKTVYNEFTSYTIVDADGNEIDKNNYVITFEEGTLVVKQKAVTITTGSGEWTYDGEEHTQTEYTHNGLLNGHVLDVTNSTPITDVQTDADGNVISIDNIFTSYKVMSGDVDVTSNYAITISDQYGTLTITKRPVTITTGNGTWIYDGEAHTQTEYTHNGLLDGHSVNVTNSTSITDVKWGEDGKVVSVDNIFDLESLKIMSGDVDVTINYAITISEQYGTLTVTPREITIVTDSYSWMYDGISHNNAGYILYNAVKGHELSSITSTSITNVQWNEDKVVGVYNKFDLESLKIMSGDKDVTSNYTIVGYTWGTLTVTPKPITVVSASASKVYDGTPLAIPGWVLVDGSHLVGGHTLAGTTGFTSELINVVSTTNYNEATAEVTIKEGDVDVTSNYEITISDQHGTLEITKRPITVVSASGTWTYDGQEHTKQDGWYVVDDGGLELKIKGLKFRDYANRTDVGTVENAFDLENDFYLYYVDENGDEHRVDATNYNIACSFGTLTVNKKAVTITTATEGEIEWTYDGQKHSNTSYTASGFVNGHYLTDITSTVITEANADKDGKVFKIVKNEFEEFTIKDADGNYVDTDNYDITWVYGEFKVTPKPVVITTDDYEEFYNGKEHSQTKYTDTGLLTGHKLEDIESTKITNANVDKDGNVITEVKNIFTSYKIMSGETDVTANYAITYEWGTITIKPAKITIETLDRSWIYDGIEHSDEGSRYQMSTGHYLMVTDSQPITNVGTAANTIYNFVIEDANGETISNSNYDITFVEGTLTVTQLSVTINTNSPTWTYDGIEHSDEGSKYQMPTGHYLVVTDSQVITNAGFVKNQIYAFVVEDANGNLIDNDNYVVTFVEGTLEITKRPITVVSASGTWTYDGTAHSQNGWFVVDGIVDGHVIADGIELTATITNAGSVNNTYTGTPWVEIKSDGVDVTSNYIISYACGTLTVKPREITITTHNGEWTYDGEAHTQTGHTTENMVDGHYLDATTIKSTSILNVVNKDAQGSVIDVKNAFTAFTIKDADGNEISKDNYNITFVEGTLKVNPREITITTHNGEWTYDGVAHTQTGYTAENMVDGHYLDVTKSMSITIAGTAGNEFTEYTIKDASGKVVDKTNYAITSVRGTLEVTKRPITVVSASASKTYDGTALKADGWSVVSGLVSGHTFVGGTKLTASITDAGSIANTCGGTPSFVIKSGNDDVTANYDITYEHGTLTVTPIEITITTNSPTWEYDGAEHSDKDSKYLMATGHYLVVTDSQTITNAGTAANRIYEFKIEDADGKEISKDNYVITFVERTLTVKPREITVESAGANKTYDGTALTADGWSVTNDSNQLVGDHKLTGPKLTASITNAGSIDNTCDGTPSFVIKSGNDDVTANYKITYTWGTLEVTPKDITITTGNGTWIYDGEAHTQTEYTHNGLLDGHHLTDIISTTILNANVDKDSVLITEVKNSFTSYKIMAGDVDVTANYDIDWKEGTLTVTPKAVTITTGSGAWTYNGEGHSNTSYTASGFVNGHYLTDIISTVITNANADKDGNVFKAVNNKFDSYTIVDADGNVIDEGNYSITFVEGTLTVIPKAVTITTGDGSWEYDGEEHTQTEYTSEGMVDGHYLNVTNSTSIVNVVNKDAQGSVIEVKNKFDEFTILDANGEEIDKNNYVITFEEGTLTVTPKPIIVVTGSSSWVYDGKSHNNTGYILYNAVDGHELSSITSTSIVNVVLDAQGNVIGVKNEFTKYQIKSGNDDVTSNYSITWEEGTLTITKRPITIVSEDGDWTYDGQEHAKNEWAIVDEDELFDNLKIKGLKFRDGAKITNAGTVENAFDLVAGNFYLYNEDEPDAHLNLNNYDITCSFGTLTVTPKKITVTTLGAKKKFDGTILTNTNCTVEGLLDDHTFEVTDSTAILYVGTAKNSIYAYQIMSGNTDVTANYVIEVVEEGDLTIEKADLYVYLYAEVKEYNGEPQSASDYYRLYSDVEYEKDLKLEFAIGMTNYGTLTASYINDEFAKGKDGIFEYKVLRFGQDLTDQYNIKLVAYDQDDPSEYDEEKDYAVLTITQRAITFATASAESAYKEGVSLKKNQEGDMWVSVGSLAQGHSIDWSVLEFLGEQSPIGESYNTVNGASIIIRDENNEDVTRNYIFYDYDEFTEQYVYHIQYGTLKVY